MSRTLQHLPQASSDLGWTRREERPPRPRPAPQYWKDGSGTRSHSRNRVAACEVAGLGHRSLPSGYLEFRPITYPASKGKLFVVSFTPRFQNCRTLEAKGRLKSFDVCRLRRCLGRPWIYQIVFISRLFAFLSFNDIFYIFVSLSDVFVVGVLEVSWNHS